MNFFLILDFLYKISKIELYNTFNINKKRFKIQFTILNNFIYFYYI